MLPNLSTSVRQAEGCVVSQDLIPIAFVAMVALAVGCVAYVFIMPFFSGEIRASKRMHSVANQKEARQARFKANETASRRRMVQDTLKELDEKAKRKRQRLTVRQILDQAGLELSVTTFFLISLMVGLVGGLMAYLQSDKQIAIAAGAALVSGLGMPRWTIMFLRGRRLKKFLDDFPNAIDIVVRGVKSGLPLNDTIRIIAAEAPEPIKSEFREIVDGQALGLPIADGLERMYQRIPLPEVNFLLIVIMIQSQAGGNLAEALQNLSKVLRERKKLKGKIQAVSQEAKSSAAIIGALPILVGLAMRFSNPEYFDILTTTQAGHFMLAGSGCWMLMGVLVMRKMINFKI